MLIEQTVEFPAGPVWVELKVIPVTGKPGITVPENDSQATPRADRLLGIAAHLGDISSEELRTERLHLRPKTYYAVKHNQFYITNSTNRHEPPKNSHKTHGGTSYLWYAGTEGVYPLYITFFGLKYNY
jgi:hypothetical protein